MVRQATQDKWNEYLGKIEVEGDNEDRHMQFYTYLYCSLIHPNVCSDVNGEYMGRIAMHKTARKFYTSFQ